MRLCNLWNNKFICLERSVGCLWLLNRWQPMFIHSLVRQL